MVMSDEQFQILMESILRQNSLIGSLVMLYSKDSVIIEKTKGVLNEDKEAFLNYLKSKY